MEKNTQTTWKIIKLKQSQTESNNIQKIIKVNKNKILP